MDLKLSSKMDACTGAGRFGAFLSDNKNSSLVATCLGAIPCSSKSYTTCKPIPLGEGTNTHWTDIFLAFTHVVVGLIDFSLAKGPLEN